VIAYAIGMMIVTSVSVTGQDGTLWQRIRRNERRWRAGEVARSVQASSCDLIQSGTTM